MNGIKKLLEMMPQFPVISLPQLLVYFKLIYIKSQPIILESMLCLQLCMLIKALHYLFDNQIYLVTVIKLLLHDNAVSNIVEFSHV